MTEPPGKKLEMRPMGCKLGALEVWKVWLGMLETKWGDEYPCPPRTGSLSSDTD